MTVVICLMIVFRFASVSYAQEEQTSSETLQPIVENSLPAEKTSHLKKFGQDLGQNFRQLFSSANLKPFLFLTVATMTTYQLDDQTKEVFANKNHSDAFSNIGNQIGKPYTIAAGVGGLYLIGVTTKNQKIKSVSYDLLNGYVIESVVVMSLKGAVGRERPDGSDDLSFPSGHSATGFLCATVLNHHYGPKVGIPAYLTAAYISASRVKRNVHYLSDVVAGAGIGYLIGMTVTRFENDNQKLLWMPSITRTPHGGMNLEVTLIF